VTLDEILDDYDDGPNDTARKQAKEAIKQWALEMLETATIRPERPFEIDYAGKIRFEVDQPGTYIVELKQKIQEAE
jgi:hypothetical protein